MPLRIFRNRDRSAANLIVLFVGTAITAWPALPVIAVMIAERDGKRAAWRFVATSAVTACLGLRRPPGHHGLIHEIYSTAGILTGVKSA